MSFKELPDGSLLHFHDLRHVYGQSLKDAGVPMADIQSLLGHSSIRTTEKHYANLNSPNIKEKVKALDELYKSDE